jgi:hypothetical protein
MHRPGRARLVAWAIPGWAIVAAVWVCAVRWQPGWLIAAGAFAASSLLVAAMVVIWWVAHNQRLAYRHEAARGARSASPTYPIVAHTDALGRAIALAPGVDVARHVIVRVDGGTKRLEPVEHPST